MLQFHSRIRTQRTLQYNGMTIGLLHDQDRLRNRLLRSFAFRLPGPLHGGATAGPTGREGRACAAAPPEGVVPVSVLPGGSR